MAISQNSQIAYTDLQSRYNSFNSFIASYGGSIAQLSVPANSPHQVDDADINNLNGKINEFKNDTYLGTKSSWWVNKTVSAGSLAYASDWTNINTTIGNFASVKCRNQGTYLNTNHSNQCTQGTQSVACTYADKNNQCTSQGDNTVSCQNEYNSVSCQYTTNAINCGNSQYHNKSGLPASFSRASYTAKTFCYAYPQPSGYTTRSSGSNKYLVSLTGTWKSGMSASWCRSLQGYYVKAIPSGSVTTKVYATSSGNKTHTYTQLTNAGAGQICANNPDSSTNNMIYTISDCEYSYCSSQYCSKTCTAHTYKNNACTQGTRTVDCSANGQHSNTCSQGSNGVSCSYVAKQNQTYIDITCIQSTCSRTVA